MITEKLTQFAEAVSVRLYVKRPAPMEQDWRLDNWDFPCIVAIPAQESETVQETSGRVERRDFELMALRSVDVTFDTAEADASTEIARTEVLDFAQQMRGVFHVEHLGGRQIWDSSNGELIVGWSLRLRLTELVGESACGGEPDPAEIEITENGTYNVLPFGRAVVDVQGGTPAVVEPLEVEPTTEAQTLTPPAGTDGYAPVTVDAVTAAIDANIQAGNIKKDVEILGVVGTIADYSVFRTYFWRNGLPVTRNTSYDASLLSGELIDTNNEYSGIGAYALRLSTVTKIVSHATGSYPLGGNSLKGFSTLEYIEIDAITNTTNEIFPTTGFSNLKFVKFKNCTVCNGFTYMVNNGNLEYFELGTLTAFGVLFYYAVNKLRNFIVGNDTAIDLPLSKWTATNVIAEGQSGIDELNANIVSGLADKVADRTGDTALTVTFGAALYNVLTAETIAAFTAKNWNVASA